MVGARLCATGDVRICLVDTESQERSRTVGGAGASKSRQTLAVRLPASFRAVFLVKTATGQSAVCSRQDGVGTETPQGILGVHAADITRVGGPH